MFDVFGVFVTKNILTLFLGTLWKHIRKKTAKFSPLLFQRLLIHFLLLLSPTTPQRAPFTGKSKHLLFKPTVSFSSCPPSLFSHLTFNPIQPTDDSLHSLHLNLHNPLTPSTKVPSCQNFLTHQFHHPTQSHSQSKQFFSQFSPNLHLHKDFCRQLYWRVRPYTPNVY